ncbi:hypothetical protein E2C01_019583 [Portunus trituberculatus]|uniref:Uncharacterized protein n=1 Tax=Portunus trituberculatus TaxID=210409 RepID=A0A5B7E0U6_PORTR|nr:hypothetical protein [Portunus trituberculatus]
MLRRRGRPPRITVDSAAAILIREAVARAAAEVVAAAPSLLHLAAVLPPVQCPFSPCYAVMFDNNRVYY